jgi:hypothetical protein
MFAEAKLQVLFYIWQECALKATQSLEKTGLLKAEVRQAIAVEHARKLVTARVGQRNAHLPTHTYDREN